MIGNSRTSQRTSAIPLLDRLEGRYVVVLPTLVVAFLLLFGAVAWACVPQRGELEVRPFQGQNSEVIIGDNSTDSVTWCGDIDQAAEAGDNDQITVEVWKAAPNQINGCPEDIDKQDPDTGPSRLPEGDNYIVVHETDAYTRQSSTDPWEFQQGGCFANVSGDDPDEEDFRGAVQGEKINVDSDGEGQETFQLDLTGASTNGGESADDDTASILCIGEQNDEQDHSDLDSDQWVGIMSPLVTNPTPSPSINL